MRASLPSATITAILAGGLVACSSGSSDGPPNAADEAVSTASALAWPKPGTTDNALASDEVLTAWHKVEHDFYKTKVGYSRLEPGETKQPDGAAESERCIGVAPPYYSDILAHYYCWHPSYEQVIPNIRGCLSYVARGNVTVPGFPANAIYPQIYDYCLFEEYDAVEKKIPAYDQKTIDVARAAKNPKTPGVFAWIHDNEEDVFKYVMFTWYNPSAFKMEDQQNTINKFYGVTTANKIYKASDKAAVADCKAKRPVRAFSDQGKNVPIDPTDGTHCSLDKTSAPLVKHPQFDDLVKAMKKWLVDHPGDGR